MGQLRCTSGGTTARDSIACLICSIAELSSIVRENTIILLFGDGTELVSRTTVILRESPVEDSNDVIPLADESHAARTATNIIAAKLKLTRRPNPHRT